MPARRIPLPDGLRDRPFTAQDAVAAGVSRNVLRGGSVRRLYRSAYVSAHLPLTLDLRVRAALLVLPQGTVASGVTALRLLGAAVGPADPLCFVTSSANQIRREGLVVRRLRELPRHNGIRVDAEAAFVSAAPVLDLVELVSAGDWLVRLRATKPSLLVAAAQSHSGPGCAVARRASKLVRARVDSPRETRLRLVLVLAGLPEPECNVGVGTEFFFLGTPDLVYQRYRIVLEYEGDQHRADRGQWNYDIGRYDAFRQEGWRVIRVTAESLGYARSLVRTVFEALREAGYPGPEPRLTTEWLNLFT